MDLDILIPPFDKTLQPGKRTNGTASADNGHPPLRKVRLTVNLPKDLVEQLRDAVYWTPGITLAWLVARAMRTSLAELHSTNQGPFPKRSKPLRAGRPRLTGQTMNLHVGPPISVVHQAVEGVAEIGRAPAVSMEQAGSFSR